jgi:phosphatidylserine decarboxylase
MATELEARIEQFRSARQIHGGTWKMWAAAMGIKLARVPIPSRRLRVWVYRTVYGKKYSALREDQLERPLAEFRSLNDLFVRGVRAECRPVAAAAEQFVCPCDSTVQDLGRLHDGKLLTVKGIEYTLDSLLPGVDVRPYVDGSFGVFFLSPADCHRVFSPHEAALREVIHVPGRRLLVHPPYQRKEFPVFALNERLIMRLDTPLGRCVLVMVAGWGVGNITHPFPMPLRHRRRHVTRHVFEQPPTFDRGQWLATFGLGSTVILITEPHADAVTHLERDQIVQYGQSAFSFAGAAASSDGS